MGKPKDTENIGNYWKIKYHYTEYEIIDWINNLIQSKYHTLFNNKIYKTERSFLSVVNRKLDSESQSLFKYYFRKIHLNDNKCTWCNKEIEKEFIIGFKGGINHLPKWCYKHYNEKKWLENNGSHSQEANNKRSEKRKIFLNSLEGEEYKKQVGEFNSINTRKWKSKLTPQKQKEINNKSSQSQIKNILEGKFDPQKNYKHYQKNTCYVENKPYIFRSSWEVLFFISNPKLKYETIRIKYLKNNGEYGIYIPDFIDYENKIIYELKPRRNYIKQQPKMDGGISWCLENNYQFIWINENNLLDYIDERDNQDPRNNKFYIKAYKGINGEIKNQINKKNRKKT